MARVGRELGWRLACNGYLSAPEDVRDLTLTELKKVVELGEFAADLEARRRVEAPQPPAVFRLDSTGAPVAEPARRKKGAGPRGAGGGRASGPVHLGTSPAKGDVLVVKVLDPSLAPLLPRLGGLVSETGSVLSHLAILAREYGIPTVVGVPDACSRFDEGTVITVDGNEGHVDEVDAT
jgi:pyruvate,water dikinase